MAYDMLKTSVLNQKNPRINRKYKIFKSGSNGLAMVDYPIYNPIYDNGRHRLA